MNRTFTAIKEASGQLYGYARWCFPRGHLWSGRSEEHPNWRGLCVTCGWIAKPRPGWRRFILMGDCVPDDESASVTLDNSDARFTVRSPEPHYPDEGPST